MLSLEDEAASADEEADGSDANGKGQRKDDRDGEDAAGSSARNPRSLDSNKGSGSKGAEAPVDLRDLDLRISVDVDSMARAQRRPLSPSDVQLLKYLMAAALGQRVAVPDEKNPQRREQDCRCVIKIKCFIFIFIIFILYFTIFLKYFYFILFILENITAVCQ